MKRQLLWTPAFTRSVKRLFKRRPDVKEPFKTTLNLLELDAFDTRLHTHKLKGQLSEYWACSAGYDLRVLFQLIEEQGTDSVLLHSLGTHDEVY